MVAAALAALNPPGPLDGKGLAFHGYEMAVQPWRKQIEKALVAEHAITHYLASFGAGRVLDFVPQRFCDQWLAAKYL